MVKKDIIFIGTGWNNIGKRWSKISFSRKCGFFVVSGFCFVVDVG